jgi:type I restriction enzyme, S subunit
MKVVLDSLCEIVRGSSPRPQGDPRYYGGPIPRLMVSDVTRDGMYVTPQIDSLTEEGALKSRPMKKGDVVIAVSGDAGEPCILNVDACIHDGFVGLRNLNEEKVFKPYLYQYLKSVKLQNSSLAVGAIYKNLNTDQIRSIPIPLPPLSEQKRIAELLDAADSLRKKDKALLEKYDQLAQSLFLEMFGDPVKNEKGWEKLEFGKTVKNLDSQRIPVKSSDRSERTGRFPYYGASGIIDYVDDYIFNGSFLLIGEDGNNLVSRSTPIAFLVNGKCWVNNHAHILESIDKSNLTYLKFYINNIDLKPYISGSAQPKLNRKNLDGILINLPPIELQNQFAEQVQLIEKQKEIAKQNLEKSEGLMKGLMGEVFG